ncbi:hypothetical protein [Actinoplanes sp. HUAS TT8]|uniref:hypothetical protein n=1 Tax=Actinoplanes sp. HUAS TT8 TaxID=3447453 RepID=UPI003F51D9C7
MAHVCWQFVPLGPRTDPAGAARRVRVIADAYGLASRDELIDTVLWWQERCADGIAAAAAAGDPAMVRLRDSGAVDEVRAARDWTATHRDSLSGPDTIR